MAGKSTPLDLSRSNATGIESPAGRAPRRRFRLLGLLVHTLVWGYFCFLLAVLVLIRSQGERWWIATLVLFGPRWIYGVPLVLLVPLILLARRRLLWVLTPCILCLIFPVIGFCLPWRTWLLPAPATAPLRVLTCNMHRQMLDPSALVKFIAESAPQVIVLQEWTSRDQGSLFGDPAWNLRRDGELMLASKYPIQRVTDIAQDRWGVDGAAVCYEILTPSGPIRLVNLHLASPHIVFSDALHRDPAAPAGIAGNCQLRREQSALLADFAGASLVPTLVAGDFNTPADSSIFRNSWSGFTDAFGLAGTGIGNTYYAKWSQTRIDHILFSAGLQCRRCSVGPKVGSPHRPLLAEFEMAGP